MVMAVTEPPVILPTHLPILRLGSTDTVHYTVQAHTYSPNTG